MWRAAVKGVIADLSPAMFNKLSIRLRLNAALTLLAALLTAIGIIGVVGMRASDADIREIHTNQLASTASATSPA
ncbi:Tar ligand binding domain-containing protein [Cupriavidus sp. RAF12]|uniref:Tar ligand binding domain-containing protein n=1 Tax=Cupriavidus sp. RAF12 TaxID=3233050 RepID=UPI003F8E0DE2